MDCGEERVLWVGGSEYGSKEVMDLAEGLGGRGGKEAVKNAVFEWGRHQEYVERSIVHR